MSTCKEIVHCDSFGHKQNKAKRFAKQQQSNVEMLWLAYIAISCKQSKLVGEEPV